MPAKKTIVRFYSVLCFDEDGEARTLDEDFWPTLIAQAGDLDEEERTVNRRYRELIGVAGKHERTHLEYLYIGKPRHKADYPDDLASGAVAPSSLANNSSIFRMSEWTYVIPTGVEATVAVVKSSGGSTPDEIAAWAGEVSGLAEQGIELKLVAILDENQMEVLDRADLVASLDVAMVGSQIPSGDEERGEIEAAAAKAANIGGDQAKIEMRWSFGRVIPDTVNGMHFAKEAKKFLKKRKYDKAIASLKTQRPDGTWETDVVNFVTEMVTCKVSLSNSLNEAMALDSLLPQIVVAIDENRKYLLRL